MAAAVLAHREEAPEAENKFRPAAAASATHDSPAAIATVREWIDERGGDGWSAEERSWARGAAPRFLRAHRGELDSAKAGIGRTVEWRRTGIKPDSWAGRYSEENHKFCFIPLGLDLFRRPVVYGCPARASCSDVDSTIDHVVMDLEYAFANEFAPDPEERCAGQWVWIVDFHGFGLAHATNPSLGRRFVSVFDQHCPERLGCLVLLDPPFVFSMLLGALRPFLDPATAQKIVTVSSSDTEAELRAVLPEDMLGWVLEALRREPSPGSLPFPLPSSAYWSHPAEDASESSEKLPVAE
ncbi:hypothetical protein FNF29_03744 [Cafeteria roenbergensis]|uniref:CRAL-TRIO domain-containing protein n=1 Tax=Cafeteria roenbergensis TaxID=33653 RepID=A0A5A8CIU7_CAFRO|nr:hypothetical protein FNF29_03744 [Cafeteria roenbergensis]|eukprot:KAA0152517.1 hypothetical protein FNF29_03744 [Cafeteria roenbergensis]